MYHVTLIIRKSNCDYYLLIGQNANLNSISGWKIEHQIKLGNLNFPDGKELGT